MPAAWQSGLRFDLRYSDRRDVGLIGLIGVNWGNEFKPTERLTLRLIGLTAVEVGNNARNGVFLQSRARLAWTAATGMTVGVDPTTFTDRRPDSQRSRIRPIRPAQ